MSKKIAELTKIIYNLRVSHDNLELRTKLTELERVKQMKEVHANLSQYGIKELRTKLSQSQLLLHETERNKEEILKEFQQFKTSAAERERSLEHEHQSKANAITMKMVAQKQEFESKLEKQQEIQRRIENAHKRAERALQEHFEARLKRFQANHEEEMGKRLREMENFRETITVLKKDKEALENKCEVFENEFEAIKYNSELQDKKIDGLEMEIEELRSKLKDMTQRRDEERKSYTSHLAHGKNLIHELKALCFDNARVKILELTKQFEKLLVSVTQSIYKEHEQQKLSMIAQFSQNFEMSNEQEMKYKERIVALEEKIENISSSEVNSSKIAEPLEQVYTLEGPSGTIPSEESAKQSTSEPETISSEQTQIQTAHRFPIELEISREDDIVKKKSLAHYIQLADSLSTQLSNKEGEMEELRREKLILDRDLKINIPKLMEIETKYTSLMKENQDLSKTCEQSKALIRQLENKKRDTNLLLESRDSRIQCLELEVIQLTKDKEILLNEKKESVKEIERLQDEVGREKSRLQAQFDRSFEQLRNMNIDREQQLLTDFEFKLRDIEKRYKVKLEEKDKEAEERIILERLKREFSNDEILLKEKTSVEMVDECVSTTPISEEMNDAETAQSKSLKAEVKQLQGLTFEQQRALKVACHQIEQLKMIEKSLQEDIRRVKQQVAQEKEHQLTLQVAHKKQIQELERSHMTRLKQQMNEINAEWDERLKEQCGRLKSELEQIHLEEKLSAVETVKMQISGTTKVRDCCLLSSNLKSQINDPSPTTVHYNNEMEDDLPPDPQGIAKICQVILKCDVDADNSFRSSESSSQEEIDKCFSDFQIGWPMGANGGEESDLGDQNKDQV